MKYEVLLHSVLIQSFHKATELVENYDEHEGFKTFDEHQRVFDLLTYKRSVLKQIKKDIFQKVLVHLYFMAQEKSELSKEAFLDIKKYPMIIWMECIGAMESHDIMALLKNFHQELTSSLIEICVVNLSEDLQLEAIDKYQGELDIEDGMYSNFYYSVCDKARLKLREYFPSVMGDDVLLELQDLDEETVIDKLYSEKERLMKLSSDDLVEFILLKATNALTLNKFIEIYKDKVNDCSISKFKLLFMRYRYIRSGNIINNYGGKTTFNHYDETEFLSNGSLFSLFRDRLHEIGIQETLLLFGQKSNSYSVNPFTVYVILEFLDIAYDDLKESEFLDDYTIQEIVKRFEEQCRGKEYSLDDFELLVNKIGKDGKVKLIMDDYIEAIIACGKLLKEKVINDKNPTFLKLREMFTKYMIDKCAKDGTYTQDISLNGVFYRLAKGTVSFVDIYMTDTYKGLIYLSKCGEIYENPDYITNFLTDIQIAKLNIVPAIRWRNAINKNNPNKYNLSFVERMGLQLLCYFGQDKGKYLLESNMTSNRMENLFDGLNYANVTINEDGTPNVNEELSNFLFGRGMMKETNSVINRMIREEIPEFESYFVEFCNTFEEIKASCNGILSIKRVINHFRDQDLPIELKPDELVFKTALHEMNTFNLDYLNEAIGLCKDARNRGYSSIPKVEGNFGNFSYKVLDLDDPMAVAVGYLSHCCFVIRGISYSALKHSMQSINGRTFVVYYNGKFLTQSWIWRNGDVICFDSVEAGCRCHEMYNDEINLVDVYKKAAEKMLYISGKMEDDIQKVKVVTVGKSDFKFEGLEAVQGDVPRPLEKNVHVYDSNTQEILAGEMPDTPRYGIVGAQYKDPRMKPLFINDVSNTDIDLLDDISLNIRSLRYQIYGDETPLDYEKYTKIVLGSGWYILIYNDNVVESGVLGKDEELNSEYNKYLSKFDRSAIDDVSPFVKCLKPLTTNK